MADYNTPEEVAKRIAYWQSRPNMTQAQKDAEIANINFAVENGHPLSRPMATDDGHAYHAVNAPSGFYPHETAFMNTQAYKDASSARPSPVFTPTPDTRPGARPPTYTPMDVSQRLPAENFPFSSGAGIDLDSTYKVGNFQGPYTYTPYQPQTPVPRQPGQGGAPAPSPSPGAPSPSPAPVIPPSWLDFYNNQPGGQPSPQPAPQPQLPWQQSPPSGQYQPPPQTQAPTGTVNPIWPGMEPFKTGNFASNSSPMDYLGLFRESDPFWGQSLHRRVSPSMSPQHTFPYPSYSNWNNWMGNVYGAAATSPEQLSDPAGGLTPAPLYDWGAGNRVNYGNVVPGYQLSDQSGGSQANVVPGMAELIQAMMSGLNNA